MGPPRISRCGCVAVSQTSRNKLGFSLTDAIGEEGKNNLNIPSRVGYAGGKGISVSMAVSVEMFEICQVVKPSCVSRFDNKQERRKLLKRQPAIDMR